MISVTHRNLRWLPDLALIGVSLFTVAFFWLAHEGLYALDDYYYSRYAYQLLSGTFTLEPDPLGLLNDPLKERPLVFAPVALLYYLFGVNIISTTLWPLLCTLGCFVIFWALYRRQEPVVAAGAIILLGLHYFTLDLTRYLYADNILMFWSLASAAALLTARRKARATVGWGIGFTFLTFAAMLSKETIVYYFPFYVGVFLYDIWQRRHGRFWVAAFVTAIMLVIAYLAIYAYYTGDPLYRIHLIENTNEYLKANNYLQGKRGGLLNRLLYQPLPFLIGIGLGTVLIPVLLVIFNRPRSGDALFWTGLGFSALLFFWFGSTSLSQYNPITLLPRMTTPLLPPLCLAAAFGLSRFTATGRGGWLTGSLFLLCALWLRNSVSVIYGGMGLYFLGVTFLLQIKPGVKWLQPGTYTLAVATLLAIATSLAIRPLYIMRKPSVSAHFDQDRVIKQALKANARGVVFVDDYLIGNYDFYFGYQVPENLIFKKYWARDSVELAPGQKAWLLLNRSTLTNDELTRLLIRYTADSVLNQFPNRVPVAESGPVTLYEVELGK